MPDVPPPSVPPSAYDELYFREWNWGAAEWVASGGRESAGIYPGVLARAGLRPGEVVVDIGTGRGELLATAVELGAAKAYGVDYSEDAVRMARHTLAVRGVEDRAEVLLVDAREEVLSPGIADLVCMVDVVEHLTPHELDATLRQAGRLLKPGGRVFVHTTPNRLVYDVTYPVLRWVLGFGRWPKDPRQEFETLMHVNEQSPGSLRRALERAGFRAQVSLGDWVLSHMVPSRAGRAAFRLLARVPLLARFAVGDLWGIAYRRDAGGPRAVG